MTTLKTQRRLAAILAADVVGYSKLISTDEIGTLNAFRSHLTEFIEPTIAEFNGRLFKTMGDGLLAEFSSVVEAVQCAVNIQQGVVQRNAGVLDDQKLEFRIGVNLGDVVFQDGDVFGDGVNVAARLEGLAEPGGICISRSARDQIRDKLDYGLEDWGEVEVKNIPRPVRVFQVLPDSKDTGKLVARKTDAQLKYRSLVVPSLLILLAVAFGVAWLQPWKPDVERADQSRMAYPLPDKPSVAVLPFENLSDIDQEYFTDGITADVITDLSKISGLFVFAHNSTSGYKGKPVIPREVAEDLGVRYILQGSVQRSSKTIRITAQLIDAVEGKHLWAERYDRELKDFLAVQSEVAAQVAKALDVTLNSDEIERLFREYTQDIDVYDAFIQARRSNVIPSKSNVALAEKLFERVIALDPNFAGGYAGLSWNYSIKSRFEHGESPDADAQRALTLANKAVAVDPQFAWSHIALGGAHLASGDPVAAVTELQEALVIQSNDYDANLFMGFYLQFAGESALAIKHLELAKRMNPRPSARITGFLGQAYFMNGDYAKSIDNWKGRLDTGRPNVNVYTYLAAAYMMLGNVDEAVSTANKLRTIAPSFNLSQWRYLHIYKSEENRTRLYEAAVKAGVPEFPTSE